MVAAASQNTFLSLIGGEPFIIKQTWQLLEALSHLGVARSSRRLLTTDSGAARSWPTSPVLPEIASRSASTDMEPCPSSGAAPARSCSTRWTGSPSSRASGWPPRQRSRTQTLSTWSRSCGCLTVELQITYNTVTWPAGCKRRTFRPMSGASPCAACAPTSSPSAASAMRSRARVLRAARARRRVR